MWYILKEKSNQRAGKVRVNTVLLFILTWQNCPLISTDYRPSTAERNILKASFIHKVSCRRCRWNWNKLYILCYMSLFVTQVSFKFEDMQQLTFLWVYNTLGNIRVSWSLRRAIWQTWLVSLLRGFGDGVASFFKSICGKKNLSFQFWHCVIDENI